MTSTNQTPKKSLMRRILRPFIIFLSLLIVFASLIFIAMKQCSQEKKIQQLQTTLKQQNQLLQRRTLEKNDWVVLRARYLIEAASTSNLWDDQIETTIALLTQANTLLKTLHDPEIITIRHSLTHEISHLKHQPKPDWAAVLAEFDELSNLVNTLPPDIQYQTPPPSSEQSASHLETALKKIEALVIIRRHPSTIAPLMNQAEENILRRNLNLILQEAQTALYQKNNILYQHALTEAIKLINQYFDVHEPSTQQCLNHLLSLQNIHVQTQETKTWIFLVELNQWIDNHQGKTS